MGKPEESVGLLPHGRHGEHKDHHHDAVQHDPCTNFQIKITIMMQYSMIPVQIFKLRSPS
jgi:hypothetical protein